MWPWRKQKPIKKRILSFSLWGHEDVYNIGAVSNADEAERVYPGWICRFYVSESSPVISKLLRFKNVEVFPMPEDPGYAKAFWRFYAAEEPDVDAVCFRDCDSRVSFRERAAVDEWISSGKKAHVMRDIETHADIYILAGMWGVRGNVLQGMKALCRKWIQTNDMGIKVTDQMFLKDVIWPFISNDVLCHGFGHERQGVKPHPFPNHRPSRGEYVGMVIQPNEAEKSLFFYRDGK